MGLCNIHSNKDKHQEIIDFNSIILLSLITYIFTGMDNRNVLGNRTNINYILCLGKF